MVISETAAGDTIQGPDRSPEQPHVLAAKDPGCLLGVQFQRPHSMQEPGKDHGPEHLLPFCNLKLCIGKDAALEGLVELSGSFLALADGSYTGSSVRSHRAKMGVLGHTPQRLGAAIRPTNTDLAIARSKEGSFGCCGALAG